MKCRTVQTFRRHLDGLTSVNLLLTNRVLALSVSVAAYFYFFLGGREGGGTGMSVILGPSLPRS